MLLESKSCFLGRPESLLLLKLVFRSNGSCLSTWENNDCLDRESSTRSDTVRELKVEERTIEVAIVLSRCLRVDELVGWLVCELMSWLVG